MQHSYLSRTVHSSDFLNCLDFSYLTRKFQSFSPAVLLLTFVLAGTTALHASSSSTVLTLSNAYVHANSTATLTATVSSNGNPVFPGLVLFCNADAEYCTDVNVLGQAQLTSTGVATLNLRLPIGIHHIEAQFHGTKTTAPSVSAIERLRVTGLIPSSTTISVEGQTAIALVRSHSFLPATGTVNFLDATDHNQLIASATLSKSAQGSIIFSASSTNPSTYFGNPATGDFNNDGIPDIVANNNGTEIVLLGRGDGTFPNTVTLPASGGAAAVADFNGDGILDVALGEGDSPLIVLLGQPDGSFVQSATVQPSGPVASIACGDLNNDGIPDVIITTNLGAAQVFWGKGDGTFGTSTTVTINPSQPTQGVAIGDFNGDGIMDFAASDWDSHLYVELSNGDKTFTRKSVLLAGSYPVGMVTADFDHDGKMDLAVANAFSDTVTVFLGKGDGTFKAPSTVGAGYHPNDVKVADFNGDGIPDLAVANTYGQTVSILFSNGDGTFTAGPTPAVSDDPYQLAVAAFKGDGVPHIVAGSSLLIGQASSTTKATATDITVPGAGTQQIFASYGADGEHLASTSKSAPVPPAP